MTTGSIRERTPGVWEIRVGAGTDLRTGKRIQISRTVRGDRHDAEALRWRLVVETREARATGRFTMNELFDQYFPAVEPRLTRATARGYRSIIDNRLRPSLGAKPVATITPPILDAYYRQLLNSGLAVNTVRQVHAVLRRALVLAVRWNWIPYNPADYSTALGSTRWRSDAAL